MQSKKRHGRYQEVEVEGEDEEVEEYKGRMRSTVQPYI